VNDKIASLVTEDGMYLLVKKRTAAVIAEIYALQEKIEACKIIKNAKADFIKTSTGLVEGAEVKDIILMRSVVGQDFGVKAAGGIRTFEDAILMIEAGANRIGTSSGVRIMNEFSSKID